MLDLLEGRSVLPRLKAGSKSELLSLLAGRAAERTGIDPVLITQALFERERLGTTGVGGGVAIPHARLTGLDRRYAMFAQLAHPIAFEAIDDHPVDLLFLVLSPEGRDAEHLKTLSRISRLLRDSALCAKLRQAATQDGLHDLLTQRLLAA